ncbi:unnamed protein product [Candidula unifasciata]|uniref:Trafficking kinesin-binding protein milt n=1 Tax=Candidula unifasciata TaxID=100452 RepID=A0A8S3ZNY3_9EUPU|nr:unnamed protein product [Candidula unifasciata]
MSDFLCGERLSQMTKTYNDIEAVTHLLEEKERDLELAARIGQTLLSKNKELSSLTENLEEQLSLATDRDDLLRFYNEDLEHDNSGDITPNEKSAPVVSVDFLEKKVKTLEDENVNLRLESEQLKSETDNFEEKEKRLVEDCIQQLGRFLTLENLDIHERLMASTESQRRLTKELGSMHDKYDELFEMLEEAQDELRLLRGKNKVRASGQHHHSAYSVPTDSLASELETSLQQELSQSKRRSQSWKVFETARAAKRAAAKAVHREASAVTRVSLAGQAMLETDSQGPSAYPSDVGEHGQRWLQCRHGQSNPELGQPGIPGSNDLESALKRLAMRRANEQNERDFLDEEEERRRRKVQAAMSGGTSPFSVRSPLPHALRSPAGSISSSYWGPNGGSANSHHYKFSEKLQIVKPMEGSMTLRHWQHLATPHLGGIFEERDGVQMKGEKKLDLVEEIYSLSDFEEDDEAHDIQTRREQEIGLTYSFTDSTISNPGMGDSLNKLARGDQVPGSTTEPQHLAEHHVQPEDSAHSTHSRPTGLASLLQGRENTEVGRALMRVSALKSAVTSTSVSPPSSIRGSSSDFNQTVLSSRTFGSHSVGSSTPRGIPGSRSFEQAMKEYEEKRKAYSDSKSAKKPELFAPGMTGKGFLQQLKSKGYSLYGLWGVGAKNNNSVVESSTDGADGNGDGNTPTTKALTESVFSQGAGVGVLGALTNFRRNGMF